MPEAAERALRNAAEKKFPGDQAKQDTYVYGHLRRMGWKPRREHGKEKR